MGARLVRGRSDPTPDIPATHPSTLESLSVDLILTATTVLSLPLSNHSRKRVSGPMLNFLGIVTEDYGYSKSQKTNQLQICMDT